MKNKAVLGTPYSFRAAANCIYKGPLIRDILQDAGYDLNKLNKRHLIGLGLDKDF